MDDEILDTIMDKLEAHDREIQELKTSVPQAPDYTVQMQAINEEITQFREALTKLPENLKFPTGNIQALTRHVEMCNGLLQSPPTQDVRHHHHLKAGILISMALFILAALLSVWLYNTHAQLNDYKANDTKYRFLKLQQMEYLRSLLYTTDSLHNSLGSAMRDSVIQQETAILARQELLRMAEQRDTEAQQLRRKASKK